ncbi:MAG: TRAP-type C4-dicarboxylate transport system permease small subunit [Chlamydiales bacterium]|jgi:TRAP-type C4-dicarboxylate transport system permease small subunit
MNPDSTFSYTKDPKYLTPFLIFMLLILIGANFILALNDLSTFALLDQGFTEAQAKASDSLQNSLSVVYFLLFLVTGITFLRWIYRANLNSKGFGAQNMRFTPGWSIAYYFIPIASLVMPYRSLKEISKISHNPKVWKSQKTGLILPLWWMLWLASCVLGQFTLMLSRNAETIESLKGATAFSMFTNIFDIPLCLVAIILVRKISKRQNLLVTPSQL